MAFMTFLRCLAVPCASTRTATCATGPGMHAVQQGWSCQHLNCLPYSRGWRGLQVLCHQPVAIQHPPLTNIWRTSNLDLRI